MDRFGVSVSTAGLLMSVYTITGLLLALPAGLIFQKAGYKVTGLLAGGSIVLGAVSGAGSTSIGGLLSSHVIEGIGTSFMAVLAPAIIAQTFAAQKRGTTMGIWSAWVPLGSAAMLVIAPTLAQSSGWQAVWWVGAAYALVVTALYLLVVKPAPASHAGPRSDSVALADALGPGVAGVPSTSSSAKVLRNRNIWLLAVAFGAFNAAAIAMGTFMPTFLNAQRGTSLAQAALLAGIPTLITIFSAPGGGIVSDRIGSRKKPYLAAILFSIVLLPLAGVVSSVVLIPLLVMAGLTLGLIPTNIFSAAVEAAGDERLGGLAMAVIMVGQNAGMLLGPAIFGALVESAGGWGLAFASLAVMSLVGLIAGWLARVR